ncbi:MAG: methionine--tRNA ligase [Lentisphaeria bacterium]|nr:methionine--tRNA ligase [Lentisphaeria bacterium]
MTKKRLITSALPYVNNEPHLGNIIGCVLSADVFARFCRSRNYETLYVCGTDEYGTATETKALEAGVTPRQICDKFHAIHKKIYAHFNISFDLFGRTSTPTHTDVVQEIFRDVLANGHLIEIDSEQYFSETLDTFLADRLIVGTCPKCGYEDARGDQCDGCGGLLTPTELRNPRCAIDGGVPVLRETRHLYLNLPDISEPLEHFQEAAYTAGNWPNNAVTTTRAWMARGLEPRAITRDLKWGVPVPLAGFEKKVFYVWFDAPIGYVSITKSGLGDDWEKWWMDPENTELYQFMAKDNIPFHSVIFPATQLATGKPWTMVHHLSSTEYLNYEDSKFSKSRNIGVFGTDVIDLGIPVDLWRFYLLAVRPEKQDTAFCWQEFFDRVNNEFIDNIGNLVNRSLVYCVNNFDGTLSAVPLSAEQQAFIQEALALETKITAAYESVSPREAVRLILALGKISNRFFQEQEPWVTIKVDRDAVQGTINILAHVIRDLAVMLTPIMPETGERLFNMLGIEAANWDDLGDFTSLLGRAVGAPEILFPKLDNALVPVYKERFSGVTRVDPWAKIELRVGKVLAVESHPTASHLYVETIDIGEDQPRVIASGLVKHFQPEDILGQHVLVASNLSPANLSGVISDGMILCAAKKKKMEMISTAGLPVGSIVHRQGEAPEERPDKIGIDEFKAVDLRAKDGVVQADGIPLVVNGQPLRVTDLLNAKIG